MTPDAAAERVERLLEPLALPVDELVQAVTLGLELADPSLELLGIPAGSLGLAGELRGEVRERLPVLLELRAGCCELGLELGDDLGLAPPERPLLCLGGWSGGELDEGRTRLGRRPAGDDRDGAQERRQADPARIEHAGETAHDEVGRGRRQGARAGSARRGERPGGPASHLR